MTRIEVTQHNIDDAHRYRRLRGVLGTSCPIALAAKDADIVLPDVSNSTLQFKDEDGIIKRAQLPADAQAFVENFDAEDYVEPFEFEIDLEDVMIGGRQ